MPRPWHCLVTFFAGCLWVYEEQLAATGLGALVLASAGVALTGLSLWRQAAVGGALIRWLLEMAAPEEETTGAKAAVLLGGAQGCGMAPDLLGRQGKSVDGVGVVIRQVAE